MSESVSIGERITAHSADTVDAYKAYLFALHCRDYPDTKSELSAEYEALVNKTEQKFIDHVRSRLVFTLSMAIVAAKLPSRLYDAELRKETVPGMQLYLTQIVGTLAMRSAVYEGWASQNEHLSQMLNPFQNDELLRNIWRLNGDNRRVKGLNSLEVLAPGYYETIVS